MATTLQLIIMSIVLSTQLNCDEPLPRAQGKIIFSLQSTTLVYYSTDFINSTVVCKQY